MAIYAVVRGEAFVLECHKPFSTVDIHIEDEKKHELDIIYHDTDPTSFMVIPDNVTEEIGTQGSHVTATLKCLNEDKEVEEHILIVHPDPMRG